MTTHPKVKTSQWSAKPSIARIDTNSHHQCIDSSGLWRQFTFNARANDEVRMARFRFPVDLKRRQYCVSGLSENLPLLTAKSMDIGLKTDRN